MLMGFCLRARPTWCLAALLPMIRWAAMGSVPLAVVVGHLHPPASRVEGRVAGPPRPVIVKGGEVWSQEAGGLWVDPATGATSTLLMPAGGRFSEAVIAPWQDRDGGTHAVGGWLSLGTADLPTGSYLARFALPGGAMLDAVGLASILAGPPCWFPGRPDRVLFAQRDGELHEFTFPAEGRPASGDRPRRLDWRVARPLGEGSRIQGPSWPVDPRLGGLILVSVEPAAIGPRGPDFQQLWWLRIGEAGTTVEEAGPLDSRGDGEGRFPVVEAAPDGSLNLAYLVKPGGAPHHEIRLAPVEQDQATGLPSVRTDRARVLARRRHPTPPIFSTDGSSIFTVSEASMQISLMKLSLGRDRPGPPDRR